MSNTKFNKHECITWRKLSDFSPPELNSCTSPIRFTDQTKTSLENLEIGGNAWEAISGKKIMVHEFEGPTTIDGFKSQEIESVPPDQAISKKIDVLKVSFFIDRDRWLQMESYVPCLYILLCV